MYSFLAFFCHFSTFFLKILLQLKNFIQKSKCAHHLCTKHYLSANFDVLRPSQSRDIAWRKTGHPPTQTQLILASVKVHTILYIPRSFVCAYMPLLSIQANKHKKLKFQLCLYLQYKTGLKLNWQGFNAK